MEPLADKDNCLSKTLEIDELEHIGSRIPQKRRRKGLNLWLETSEKRAGATSKSPKGSHAPELANLKNIAETTALKKYMIEIKAAERRATISNMGICEDGNPTDIDVDTYTDFDTDTDGSLFSDEENRGSGLGYNDTSTDFSDFSRVRKRYIDGLHQTAKEKIPRRDTVDRSRDGSYSNFGHDKEQTNKSKIPVYKRHGSALIAKEGPSDFSHLDQLHHPNKSAKLDIHNEFHDTYSFQDIEPPIKNPLTYQNALSSNDGPYSCPSEEAISCFHQPVKLNSDDDQLVRSHLSPYHCKISTSGESPNSSTLYLLRHERESHDESANTAENKALSESISQSELRTESENRTETDSDEVSELESDFEIDDTRYTDLIRLRDIMQHEFQQALGTKDGQTKQDFCLIKDSLICYVLERFWSWSESRYTYKVTTCAGTPSISPGSSLCETGSSEKSSQSDGQGRKRKQQANSYDIGDKRQAKRVGTRTMKEKPEKEQFQFACPFRKHNPEKYGVMQWHYCALTPYSTIARLKEHLIRGPHRVWECDRCRSSFKSEKDKINHAREEIPCSPFVEAYVEEEGIHPYHVDWLRAKGKCYSEVAGKLYSKQTEVERWSTIYKKLFSCSDDMLPSPYFEEPIEERARTFKSGDIGEFQQYFREELLHDFRQQAVESFTEDSINQAVVTLEQCTSNICTNFNERITKSSSQGNPNPSTSSISVSSQEVPVPTNNSNNQSINPGENDTGVIGSHTPSINDFTMSIFTLDTPFPETNSTSGNSYQYLTTRSQSLFQESRSQGAEMQGDPIYNGNHDNQSAQDHINNDQSPVYCDDIGGDSVEDLVNDTGTGLGGDNNTGWDAYPIDLDVDLNLLYEG